MLYRSCCIVIQLERLTNLSKHNIGFFLPLKRTKCRVAAAIAKYCVDVSSDKSIRYQY